MVLSRRLSPKLRKALMESPLGVIYARISRDQSEGWGVSDQVKRGRVMAASQGVPVVRELSDNDVSASEFSTAPRPAYEELVTGLLLGQWNYIYVTESSRLHRRKEEHFQLEAMARTCGIPLRIWQLGPDGVSPAEVQFNISTDIQVLFNAMEAQKTRDRVLRRREADALAGRVHKGCRRKFGYEEDWTTPRPGEAEAVAWGAYRLLQGDKLANVAVEWNRRGLYTVKGNPWCIESVKGYYRSSHICGYRINERVGEVQGTWEGIVDKGTWDTLQQVLAVPARQRNNGVAARQHLLPGYAYCGYPDCGHKLRTSGLRTRFVYRCINDPVRGDHGCGRIARDGLMVEQYVVGQLFQEIDRRRGQPITTDTSEHGLSQKAIKLKQRRTDLAELFSEGLMDKSDFRKQAGDLTDQISVVGQQLARMHSRGALLAVMEGDARQRWEQETLEWRRGVLGTLVDRIVLLPAKRGGRAGTRFREDCVVITFRDN